MAAFEYPEMPHERRHGPVGYKDIQSFRPWLRDEFAFRCVYCLNREQWGKVTGDFDVEHFLAQANNPDLRLDYDNLLYACHGCNLLKGSKELPDPTAVLNAHDARINPDGSIEGRTYDAKRIIAILGLDSDKFRQWRTLWMRIIQLADD